MYRDASAFRTAELFEKLANLLDVLSGCHNVLVVGVESFVLMCELLGHCLVAVCMCLEGVSKARTPCP